LAHAPIFVPGIVAEDVYAAPATTSITTTAAAMTGARWVETQDLALRHASVAATVLGTYEGAAEADCEVPRPADPSDTVCSDTVRANAVRSDAACSNGSDAAPCARGVTGAPQLVQNAASSAMRDPHCSQNISIPIPFALRLWPSSYEQFIARPR
jgi:hypothetical protein